MRHLKSAACALILAFTLSATPALGEDLERRASLGVAMAPPAPGTAASPVVNEVHPGQTAERLGIRVGDVILAVGGKPAVSSMTVVEYAGSLRAGDPVDISVRRNGKELKLRGRAIGRPFESYAAASADYGSVPFKDGALRDILVTPNGAGQAPVVFLIPGYGCTTVEPPSPDHPYRKLGAELVARGIAYYRVEKPGVGDSRGGPACVGIDFATELDAFRTAYKHLVAVRGIDPDRIFMFGHSLGGMQAPLLAVEQPPRGVAAFGTVLRNWADYHHDIGRFQSYLFYGEDPAETARRSEERRDVIRRFYLERETPAAIAAESPRNLEILRDSFGWDGGERTLGARSYRFNQDLAHLPLIAAWRDAKTNVLALYGESDIVALNGEDHRLIADIADFHRPGSGRFVEIAGTGHSMELIGNRSEVREKARTAGRVPTGPFNSAVADTIAGWIKESMGRPPVRTQSYASRAASPRQ